MIHNNYDYLGEDSFFLIPSPLYCELYCTVLVCPSYTVIINITGYFSGVTECMYI